jgi:hypothetical protein
MLRAVFVLDVVIAGLVLAGCGLWLGGGFYVQPFGIRFSARGPDRAILLALLLGFLRWRLGGAIGFLGRPPDDYRRLFSRVFQPRADEAPTGLRSRGWWHPIVAALGLLAIGAVLMHAQLRHMDSVPDLGDPLFSIWRMAWVHRQLAGDPRPLFDANIFHPTPLTLTLSDSMLLPSITASPLLSAGVAPVVAYNVLLLSGFFLSGLSVYLLVRRVTGSALAAFIGGLLYACYPYRLEHYSHLELQMTQWMPLALLCLHRFAESLRARDAVLAALCGVAQVYSSMYYGMFFLFYAAAVLIALFAVARPDWRRIVVPAAAAALVAVALAIPLARPYLAAQPMKGERHPNVVAFYSAGLTDYLRPHPRLATYGGRLLADIHPERALFPGVSPLVLSAVALVPPLGPIRLAYATGLVVALDMSRGMNGLLYRLLYDWLPPIRGMRVPARSSVIVGISLVVLGAFGARSLLHRARSRRARWTIFSALVAFIMFDLRPALDLTPVWASPPPIYGALDGRTDVVLAELPFELNVPMATNDLPFMYFSAWHGLPMVNGYSGFIPETYQKLVEGVRGFPDDTALAALRARGVTHVTVNCALMGDACPAVIEQADRSPALRLVTAGQWEGRPARLYELLR